MTPVPPVTMSGPRELAVRIVLRLEHTAGPPHEGIRIGMRSQQRYCAPLCLETALAPHMREAVPAGPGEYGDPA
jgi:hypothetical protein